MLKKEEMVIPVEKVQPLIVGGKIFRFTHDFEITEEDREKAYLDLGETENVRRSSLQALKEKLCETKNLRHHTDDEFLLRYLRYQKFNVDKAYTMLCNLYRLRSDYPEQFILPSNLEDLLSLNIVKFLPFRTEEGSLITWLDFRRFDADILSPDKAVELINAYADTWSMNPGVQVNKIIGIWDMRGMSPRGCLQYIYPSTARQLLRFLLDCYPWRIKYLILIHCNRLIHAAYSAVRFLLKKKIRDKVMLLGSDLSELHQYVNPKILPKEYGGDIEEEECFINDFILKNVSFMKYERSFKFMPS